MKLYADAPGRRSRQVLGDLLLVVWVAAWIQLALVVRDATLSLARPGRQLDAAGSGLAERLREAGSSVGDVPLVGDTVKAPFDGAGDAADQIAQAGAAQAAAVGDLAFWLAIAVAGIPIAIALLVHLPLRWRFVRTATAGQRFLSSADDLDLFALRAMSSQPLHRLARVSDDPVGAWRRGDRPVIRALAELELADSGLRYRPSVSGSGRPA